MPVKTYFAAHLIPLKSDWTVRVQDNHDFTAGKVESIPKVEIRRFEIKCGAPCGCHGVLGYITESPNEETYGTANEFFDAPSVPRAGAEVRDPGPVTCLVTHPKRYSRDEDNAYHTIESRHTIKVPGLSKPYRRGHKPLPDKNMYSAISHHFGGHGIVGQFPTLPAIIYCPECGRPQDILRPAR